MRILTIAAEALPFAGTGALGETIQALPRALARLGHTIDVVMPRYRGITGTDRIGRVSVALGGQVADADVHAAVAGGVRTIFIDHPAYFDRDYLYGAGGHDYADNPERFAFLCQAALNWALADGNRYDVAHAHDWHTGLLPVLLGRMFRTQAAPHRLPTVFTIHDLAFQGLFEASWLPRLGLEWDLMRMDAMEFWGRISYLKAGIVFSRLVTTVSPRYAEESQMPERGYGFDGILRARSQDVIGILNGIDYDRWDPARDRDLPEPFSASKLEGKGAAKREVLRVCGLPADAAAAGRPLIAVLSPLVADKGFDLLDAMADELPRLGATVVQLGRGERRFEDAWLALAARHPERIAARIADDGRLARLLTAGADLLLMPSRVEPCGAIQMQAMRYGTVPLVHATGGLFDTVRNFEPATREGTGFTFGQYSAQALLDTLRWALAVFEDRAAWRAIQVAGMEEDFSWDAAAREYVKVYERAASPQVWA
jgi:starch synthase